PAMVFAVATGAATSVPAGAVCACVAVAAPGACASCPLGEAALAGALASCAGAAPVGAGRDAFCAGVLPGSAVLSIGSAQALDALARADHVGQADTEAVVDHHHLALGD